MRLFVLILAAGLGKRMKSSKPKVLQNLGHKPLIVHVLDTLTKIEVDEVGIIYGHLAEQLKIALNDRSLTWIEQKQMKGTGDALKAALPYLKQDDMVLILYGDVPLISSETLKRFMTNVRCDQLGILTTTLENPTGLGRILRDDNHQVIGIVEEKDATEKERQIKEVNTGIYYLSAQLLQKWLPKLNNNNAQGEYYLTDIVAMAKDEAVEIVTHSPDYHFEVVGVNNRLELANLERCWQRYQAEKLLSDGVIISDPSRIDIRGNVIVGNDTSIDVNVILEGDVRIGRHCKIGPNCILNNVELGDFVCIKANSMLEDAQIKSHAEIGPYARIRPQCLIEEGAKVGNFVELKKTTIGKDSKVNHLSYLGDAVMGNNVNIGAGVITCNYDGVNKHQTVIEDDVFVGSDSQLIAPVKLAKGSYIGSGSTITKNTPEGKLTINRSNRQMTLDAWQRPKKQDKK
ncbi:bifunctional UDP-N-acetylglucosamine diphosphorylase/glucosamine-1-phosphate N-acetyltransferase GlmU [Thiotrichales bacterium 19S3-7]|nr:bifunctional UDP-N-acetylglucosamine diphosphorylase/glucosamine-1-phosphate N-acetyltransferase GlmU [Thiotrichales bacterium 19S3-7]MCF6801094.1 bifunctional UDP-N-acetylglucosamine diphosphorylase/glucosamine-1-phosphate N-acetyltransferase GlmU [Thiotrichales bacterium 19S3-11]